MTFLLNISSQCYLSRGPHGSADRHGDNPLNTYIYEYPESAFLTLFRMHCASFWQLVELLTATARQELWQLEIVRVARLGSEVEGTASVTCETYKTALDSKGAIIWAFG